MLECTTTKEGFPCIFMKKAGCSFMGGTCYPVIDKCQGCTNVQDNGYCSTYAFPRLKWINTCPMATHIKKEEVKEKKILDPRKAAKLRRKAK